ncbi:MAG: hypothetical protein SNJ54_10090 [Anaerolineae bacterium]
MTTIDLNVKLRLPEDVEQKAREAGLFTSEKIAELITAEIERRRTEAAVRLRDTMDKLSSLMQEEYGDLSEDEAQALLNQWINEADDESESHLNSTPSP